MYLLLHVREGLLQELCNILLDINNIAGGLHGGGVEEGGCDLVIFYQTKHVGKNGRMHRQTCVWYIGVCISGCVCVCECVREDQ